MKKNSWGGRGGSGRWPTWLGDSEDSSIEIV